MNKLCSTVCLTLLSNFIKIRIYEIWLYAILKHLFDLINLIGLSKVVFCKSQHILKTKRTLSKKLTLLDKIIINCLGLFILLKIIKQL